MVILDQYFTDGKTLFFHSSDAHRSIEGDTYLRYEIKGDRAEIWMGGENGEMCLIVSRNESNIEAVIKAIIYGS